MWRSALCLVFLAAAAAASAADNLEFGGHGKLRAAAAALPGDSAFRELLGSHALDASGELRAKLAVGGGRWSFAADYQLVALDWDSLAVTAALPGDRRRYLDLTSVVTESEQRALLHRLDRLSLSYTGERVVVRAGRQALSWGNGMFYAPMDLVNPFDPTAVDTEYKAGDDMLYAQVLRGNGDDLQFAYVARRDPVTGDAGAATATTALKYHGLAGDHEFDILLARHYEDDIAALGGSLTLGGAIARGDLVATRTGDDTVWQFVGNLTYSWVGFGRNMSGAFEYHFNGFGQHDGRYSPAELVGNPDLLARLDRGESFVLGRHYLAASVAVEVTPLWNLTPMVFANLEDPSGLLQLVSSYSLADDMTLLASIALPAGPGGSEFGGPESGVDGRYLSRGASVFLQFAWYY